MLLNWPDVLVARSGMNRTVASIVSASSPQMLRRAAVRPAWARIHPEPRVPASSPTTFATPK
jgi:hypothetical protein